MIATILGGLRVAEIRKKILFTAAILALYRLGAHIPAPGISSSAVNAIQQNLGGNSILGLLNLFSGGGLGRIAIFALGIMPYITSSIILQLLQVVVPSLEKLSKEGEVGQARITQYTRYLTVGLAFAQSIGYVFLFHSLQTNAGEAVISKFDAPHIFLIVVCLTAGCVLLMWIGELITQKGISNGISLLIFAGIVAGLPGAVVNTLGMANNGELTLLKLLMVVGLTLTVTAFVVFMERAQRRITVNYARRSGGQKAYMNQSSNLPLKINMAGVIPPIFASSLLMFPATAISWFSTGQQSRWLQDLTQSLSPGNPLYEIVFSVLVIGFAFFYTAIVFNADETADNLKRSGALIPGIRPGRATASYIDAVMTRLTGVGALYLVLVCLVPSFMQQSWHVPFYFGGTSLLIVVVVVMDFTAQVQAHLVSHQYESLLKKANLRRS